MFFVEFLCPFYNQIYSHYQINTASILFFFSLIFPLLFVHFCFSFLCLWNHIQKHHLYLSCVSFWYHSFVISDLIFSPLKHFESVTCVPTFIKEAILSPVNDFDAIVSSLWVSDGISVFFYCFVCDVVSTIQSCSLTWDWDWDASVLFLLLMATGCFGY